MGGMCGPRVGFLSSLSELVGYKAGLALGRDEMRDFLQKDVPQLFSGPDEAVVRIRSEEFESMLAKLLHSVGNIDSPSTMPGTIRMFHRVKNDPELLKLYEAVGGEFPNCLERAMDECLATGRKSIDPRPFFEWAKNKHGLAGAAMALQLVEGLAADQHRSANVQFREIEWKDTAELKELFRSENLKTPHGKFFDQRFIDFLSHNFDSIDQIHWRKFEGLTCEFFEKLGFHVEIGQGRNDDSVDARIWSRAAKDAGPLMLVQCKRQKDKVEKVVVKALHTDVTHESAQLGLIVTSSALSPGATKVCRARGYPIAEANRKTLQQWIHVMRTPYKGVFLGQ
jgi:restriction system protein